jgi:streptogramin lyase
MRNRGLTAPSNLAWFPGRRSRHRTMVVACLLLAPVLGTLATGEAAFAAVGTVTTYSDPTIFVPGGITTGSDGALWFANEGNASIGRITTAGVVTNYSLAGAGFRDGPSDIAAGSDGNLWFTTGTFAIGRITPSGVVTKFPAALQSFAITAGPDGALWFTSDTDAIGRITTSGFVTTYSDMGIRPTDITSGPDGALWFTGYEISTSFIGRITTSGAVTKFTDSRISDDFSIATGSDGALWFTNFRSIGRITTSGALQLFAAPGITGSGSSNGLVEIAPGPDGNMWVTSEDGQHEVHAVGDITPSGVVTTYSGTPAPGPAYITPGPDGNMWFTNPNNSIGRVTTGETVGTPMITGVDPTSGTPGQTVTINGLNLEGATEVKFKGADATITSDTFSQITVAVPAGAISGQIKVTTPGGKAKTFTPFVVS